VARGRSHLRARPLRQGLSGVYLIYYGNQRQFEYGFLVSPGQDAATVKLQYEGVDKVETDAASDMFLTLRDAIVP
jgi:hypothetical protein